MRKRKYYLCLSNQEHSLTLQALVEFKNRLVRDGKYTDAVDELIIKISKAKIKNIRVI